MLKDRRSCDTAILMVTVKAIGMGTIVITTGTVGKTGMSSTSVGITTAATTSLDLPIRRTQLRGALQIA
jgi:hypothetical protein